MESNFILQNVRIDIFSNFVFWLDTKETLRLLATWKKLWAYKSRNEIWMQVFEKNSATIFDKRRKLTIPQLLQQEGISSQINENKFEIYINKLRYNLKLVNDLTIIDTMKLLHNFIKTWNNRKHVEMTGIEDSSHDYNQTIHLTLDTRDLNSFWSSKGSDSADSSEWLLYKINDDPWLISSVMITAFQAMFHYEDPVLNNNLIIW